MQKSGIYCLFFSLRLYSALPIIQLFFHNLPLDYLIFRKIIFAFEIVFTHN